MHSAFLDLRSFCQFGGKDGTKILLTAAVQAYIYGVYFIFRTEGDLYGVYRLDKGTFKKNLVSYDSLPTVNIKPWHWKVTQKKPTIEIKIANQKSLHFRHSQSLHSHVAYSRATFIIGLYMDTRSQYYSVFILLWRIAITFRLLYVTLKCMAGERKQAVSQCNPPPLL